MVFSGALLSELVRKGKTLPFPCACRDAWRLNFLIIYMKFSSAIVVIFLHLAHLCGDLLCTKYCSGSEQERFWHFLVGGRQTDNQSIINQIYSVKGDDSFHGGKTSRRWWEQAVQIQAGVGGAFQKWGRARAKALKQQCLACSNPVRRGAWLENVEESVRPGRPEGRAWSFVDMGWLGEEHVGEGGTQRWAWKWKVSGAHWTPSGGFE